MKAYPPTGCVLALALALLVTACSAGWPDRAQIDTEGGEALAALEADLKRRVTQEPDDEVAWWRLAWVQLRQGDPEAAEQSAWNGVQAGPEEVEGHVVLGWAQWAADRPRRALGAFGQALQFDPLNTDARVGLALTQERLGRLDTAQETIAEGLRLDPGNPRLLYQSARLHYRLGQWQEATDQVALLRRQRPGQAEDTVLLADLLRRSGRYREAVELADQAAGAGHVGRLAREVVAATRIEEGRMDDAFTLLNGLAEEEPLGVEALLALVAILEHRGQAAAAERELATLMRRFPSHASVINRMGRRQVRSGRYQEALRTLRGAKNFTPDEDTYYWRALAAFQLEENDLGESALAAAERLAPADPAVMLARIERLTAQGHLAEATGRLGAFRKMHPGDTRQAIAESALAARAQRLDAAEGALAGASGGVAARALEFARLRIAVLRKDWPVVERQARTLREDPVLGWRSTYLLGLALLGSKRDADALRVVTAYLEQAGESAPERVLFAHLAGYLHWLTGDRRNAERVLSTALARNPDHPLLLEALSRVHLAHGDRDRALPLLRKGAGTEGPLRTLFQERLTLNWPPGPVGMERDAVRAFLIETLLPTSSEGTLHWPLADVLFDATMPDRPPVWHPGVAEPPREVPRFLSTQ